MGLLGTLLLLLVLICAALFILLFGENPRLRHGIIGKAHSLLTSTLPKTVSFVLRKTIGPTNMKRLGSCWSYCCESRNPFLQIFFILLTSVSIGGFLKHALPHIPGIYLHPIHLYIIPFQIICLYISYYIACTSDPGTVTEKNVQFYMDLFPYDGLLYTPKVCPTCHLPKPARSKHCSLCKTCVSQMDHHCAWLNRCVGYNNHRYFFMFLFYLTQFCTYGFYLCFQVYRGMVIEWGLDRAYLHDRRTGQQIPLTFRKAMIHVLQKDRVIGSIGILSFVMGIVVFIFMVYQLYLAGRGITTNEAFKWEMLEDAIDRGDIWIIEEEEEKPIKPKKSKKSKGSKKKNGFINDNDKGKRQFIQKRTISSSTGIIQEHQVKSLEEVDNIYDHGFFRNLWNIFFPISVPS
ncbi:DHHC palmitoyltransferase-domain-containing protein [Halteromyces radiatus]|uniref:DHHC palmitoyltransferase-domain-containing protein n=1 Tax=Halteromyces radiatus TaxID=101107 RepID=UPI00221E5B78|nr:DHHC palmitoyltransferase-domain-containing protein [Halteromyces radiatus]KAI8093380.1 DHHC palmitoyltransferase-domain-containing protein [Halteromyces radiatus]